MPKVTVELVTCMLGLGLLIAPALGAQTAGSLDQVMDQIRNRSPVSASDQRRITDWAQGELNRFSDIKSLRQRFRDQADHSRNSADFNRQLAVKIAEIATAEFRRTVVDIKRNRALAQVLVDLARGEVINALLAGLDSKDAATRYLCVVGLTKPASRRAIQSDATQLGNVVQRLQSIGEKESDPVALTRIYEALALPRQAAAVFDAYVAIFDSRLAIRRKQAGNIDRAEAAALEFFADATVLGNLSAAQKAQLVGRLAVFFRFDVEQYDQGDLQYRDMVWLEWKLWVAEEVLSGPGMVGNGGDVRGAISAGGHLNRAQVHLEVQRWVGDTKSKQAGTLNAAPWSVPIGAP